MGNSWKNRPGPAAEMADVAAAQGLWERARPGYRQIVPWMVAVTLVLVWAGVAASGIFPKIYVPSPLRVVRDSAALATSGFAGVTLLTDVLASVGRISAGFIAAILVGVPIGFWMATSEIVFAAIDPMLQFLRPIPPLAYIPIMIIWFGIGELSKVILIFFCTIPIIIISAMSGVRGTQETRLRVARCFGATRWQIFRYVILPSALPEIFTGMRVAIGVAWTCLVAAEMIASQSGLGAMIHTAGNEIRTGVVFVGIIFIGLIGYTMELIIRLIEKRVIPWKGQA